MVTVNKNRLSDIVFSGCFFNFTKVKIIFGTGHMHSYNIQPAEHDITQPIFVDSDHALTDAFENEYVPAYYVFDKTGQLRHFQAGGSGMKMLEKKYYLVRYLFRFSQNAVHTFFKHFHTAPAGLEVTELSCFIKHIIRRPAYYVFDKTGQLRHFQAGGSGMKMLEKRVNRVLAETE